MSHSSATATSRLVEIARDSSGTLHEQHDAFTRLVHRSQHLLFAIALSSLRDVDDAKDAVQDAFATAWHRLRQLRDPAAFEPWLKAIVARECSRRRPRRAPALERGEPIDSSADARRSEYHDVLVAALGELPEGERHVTVLFYFLGYTQPQIARLLRLKSGTVGKRLHSARLRIRRRLPRSIRDEFVRRVPSAEFAERVRRGLLDEYVGVYRFERRPGLTVTISRDGDSLLSESNGQRHVLLAVGDHSLATAQYDGTGHFGRDRNGRVTHFVYYEFGRRLGVARKVRTRPSVRRGA